MWKKLTLPATLGCCMALLLTALSGGSGLREVSDHEAASVVGGDFAVGFFGEFSGSWLEGRDFCILLG
jgi:hypothetical protein